MQSFECDDHGRVNSAYVRRRLAEATLAQDRSDGSTWRQLEPGAPAVASLSPGAGSLHSNLLGNALDHLDRFMSRDTFALPVGEALEAQIHGQEKPSSDSTHPDYTSPTRKSGASAEPTIASPFGQTQSEENQMQAVLNDIDTLMGDAIGPNPAPSVESDPAPSMNIRAGKPLPSKRSKQGASIQYPHGDTIRTICNVSIKGMKKRCPILAIALEDSRSGPLLLESLSAITAEPFVRFLSTGSYANPSEEWSGGGRYEDVPTSVLLHCEMWRLGDIYDMSEMKSQAYVNLLRQCEFGCSTADKPIDLCAAIRFVYEHLASQEQLIDALVNYCVSCFLCHRLGEDAEFRQLAYDLRPFHQALCKNCMERDFENDTAAAIIQLPFAPYRPKSSAFTEDVVYHFHASDEDEPAEKGQRPGLELQLPIRAAPSTCPRDDGVIEGKPGTSEAVSSASMDAVDAPFEELKSSPRSLESDSDGFDWVDVPVRGHKSLPLRPSSSKRPIENDEDESDSSESWVEI